MVDRARAVHQDFGFACGLSATPTMAMAHRHDDVEIVLSMGGAATMEHGGRRHRVSEAGCGVFWAAIPHRLADTDPGVAIRWLTVPLVEALACSLPADFRADLLRGKVSTFPASTVLAGQMATWAAEIGTDRVLTAAARQEATGLLLRISARGRARRSPGSGVLAGGSDRQAAAIAAYVSTHFTEALQIADIAAAVHLHPSTAGSIFRAHTGVTIGHYLAQCRVAEAQRLLISTEATTTDIAHRAGFSSTSRFYATFVEHCQLTPAAYRRSMRFPQIGTPI
jgi:AraC-like DNA-binding protein